MLEVSVTEEELLVRGPANPAGRIRRALQRCDRAAVAHQHRRRRLGLFTLLLGQIALTVLALHLFVPLVFEPGSWWFKAGTVTLVVAEGLALALLVSGLLPTAHEHEEWVRERVRAELLRRELFLLQARVGPYLVAADPDPEVEHRVGRITSHTDPLPLIATHDGARSSWRDALEDTIRAGSAAPIPDLRRRLEEYRTDRVRKQHDWFVERSVRHGRADRSYELEGRLLIFVGLLLAATHGLVAVFHGAFIEEIERLADAGIMFLGFACAAVGAFIVGRRSLFQTHRLSRSYAQYADMLDDVDNEILELLPRVETETEDVALGFRRLVLHTEDLLANELRIWWLAVQPEVPA